MRTINDKWAKANPALHARRLRLLASIERTYANQNRLSDKMEQFAYPETSDQFNRAYASYYRIVDLENNLRIEVRAINQDEDTFINHWLRRGQEDWDAINQSA